MLKRSFILVCVLFICSLLEAQKKVYVRGYILDENQQAVELATVLERNQLQGTTSNSNGFYELMLEKSDTFFISFSCIGYQSVEKKIVSVFVNLISGYFASNLSAIIFVH